MKIAMIQRYLPSDSRGGVGYYVHRLSNKLIEKGHYVAVYSLSPKPSDAKYDVINPVKKGLKIFRSRSLSIFAFAVWIAIQKYNSFDIIHAHGDNFLLYRKQPPVIRTFHGLSLLEARFADKFILKIYYLAVGVLSEIISSILSQENIGVSKLTKKYLPLIKKVIYSGYDEKIFKPGGKKAENPVVLFIGYLKGRKRGDFLKKLFEEKIIPYIKSAELWMVCGEEYFGKNIKMHRYCSESELAELYKRAWVLCHPSKYEGFGLPYIEAMASGTPVVTTDRFGAIEVIGDGGVIVHDKELVPVIINLLRDKSLIQEMSTKAIERARKYTLDKCVEEYLSIYKQLSGGASAK